MALSRCSSVFLFIVLFTLAGCVASNLANPLAPAPPAPSTPTATTAASTPTSGTTSIVYSVSNSITESNGSLIYAASVVG